MRISTARRWTKLRRSGTLVSLFEILSESTRDFYPHPIAIKSHRDKGEPDEFVELSEPYLTKEKLIEIYQSCGKYLHQASPFADEMQVNQSYWKVKGELVEWIRLITRLLSTHVIHLYNEDYMWYVVMNVEDKPPFGNIFVKVDEDDDLDVRL